MSVKAMTDEITREEFDALKERVRLLESKLDGDDEQHSRTTEAVSHAFLDTHDKAVLHTLVAGEEYSIDTLTRRYKKHTRLTQKQTIKRRIKRLAENKILDHAGAARFEYTGADN